MRPLHVEQSGSGPPLLLLHGFTGSTRTWDELRPTLDRYARTIAVDLIGHGRSAAPADLASYTMERCVADLLSVLDGLSIERTAVLGYSMGGRVALQLALAAPERVSRLVLESTSPGLDSPDERAARMASDEALADALEREGLEAFVDGWERLPLLALGSHVSAVRRARLRAERLSHAPLGLANSLRGMGAGRQLPVWDRLAELGMPVLLLVGERDARYRVIGQRMRQSLPKAELVVVPDAGHMVHIDHPAAVLAALQKVIDTASGAC